MQFIHSVKRFFLERLHFLKMKELNLPQQAIHEFNEIFEQYIENGALIPYHSNYPKYLFLNYLIENKECLVHGSNYGDIDSFEPRDSLLANNKPVKAVFAASDGIWSMFFAVINKKELNSLRNICITNPTKKGIKRYYYFSVNKGFEGEYWRNGMIYIFPKQSFKQGGVKNEWICEKEIKPIAKLKVTPEDFPYQTKIHKHDSSESVLKTLLHTIVLNKKTKI